MEEALEKYDKIVVNKKYVKLLVNGVRVADGRFTKDKVINNKLYRVYDDENNFFKSGTAGIIQGIIHNYFSMTANRIHLF